MNQIHSDILLTFSLSLDFSIHKSHRSAMGFFYFLSREDDITLAQGDSPGNKDLKYRIVP